MKKRLFFCLGLLVIIICLAACERNDVKMVSKVPDGFASLNEMNENSEGVLSYIFWESQISFLDSDNNCVYQTDVNNEDFIVKCKKEYYVNEKKYLELISNASSKGDDSTDTE